MASEQTPGAPDPKMIVAMMNEFNDLFNLLRNNDESIPMTKFGRHWLPVWLPTLWPQIRNFPVRSDDITIASFPKTGSHWLVHMVYLIQTCNFEKNLDRSQRMLLEMPRPPLPSALEQLASIQEQRFLITHLPAEFLPRDIFNGRVIYIYRNAKDVAVSFYYHHMGIANEKWPFKSTFDQFASTFMKGNVLYGPYPEHVKGYAKLKDENKKILFLRYEDLKKDPKAAIRQIAEFLGKSLDEATVEKVNEMSSFKKMHDNDDINWSDAKKIGVWKADQDFFRKGKVGDWRNHFTDPVLLADFNKFITENMPPELVPPCDEVD